MQATSYMPAMYPASAEVEPIWYVAMSRGVVSVTLLQLEDAMRKGHVDASTLVTRAGMPAWYTLRVLAGLNHQRRRVPARIPRTRVAARESAPTPQARGARSWASGLIVGAVAGLLLLGGLALGPRTAGEYQALAVAASASVARQLTVVRERVRDIVTQRVESGDPVEQR